MNSVDKQQFLNLTVLCCWRRLCTNRRMSALEAAPADEPRPGPF